MLILMVGTGILSCAARGDEFKTIGECVAGKAVVTKEGASGVVVGVDKIVPNLKCKVKLDRSGQTESFIYWNLSPAGSTTHIPDRVTVGAYSCVTYAGIINHGGRVEVRPLWDVKVTGAGTYIGSDGKAGAFSYDAATGTVRFTSGAMRGQIAKYISQGGGQFVYKGETGEVDCGLDK
jgi:hypothetical protein